MNPALEELETLIAVTIHGGFSGDPRVSVPLSALERWRKALHNEVELAGDVQGLIGAWKSGDVPSDTTLRAIEMLVQEEEKAAPTK